MQRERIDRACGVAARCAAALIVAAAGAGCETAGQGAVSGGAIGALGGLAIGSMTGSAGTGAAIGAISGAVVGGVIGDQNRRKNEEAAAGRVPPPPPPSTTTVVIQPADRDRQSLGRMVGEWRVRGWSEVITGDRSSLTGTATGVVDGAYFLRLDMRLTAEGAAARPVSGTVTLASEPGLGVTMSSRFDDAPSISRFVGTASSDGATLLLHESGTTTAAGLRRDVTLRFLSADEWVVDVAAASGGRRQLGWFMFTRTR